MTVTVDPATAARLLAGAGAVTLLGHVTPDADTFGSAVALGSALAARGARVTVSFDSGTGGAGGTGGALPENLLALDQGGLVVAPARVPRCPATLVVCDTGALSRLGALADRVAATTAEGGTVLVIDHHVSQGDFATHRLVDTEAEATAVIVLRVLDALGAPLDEHLARCLYAGLVTDTSSFRRAHPGTHETAARLIAAGADPEELGRTLLDAHPFGWLAMAGAAMGRAVLEPGAVGGRGLVHTSVRTSDLGDLPTEQRESVIDLVRATSEADVAAVLKQTGERGWTVSLRSRTVDVAKVAEAFGGGGHVRAAGFTAGGTAAEVLDRLRTVLSSLGE